MIPVAAGCLIDSAGRVLIAQRPPGKIAAGKWEFPGGKIEPGESPRAALQRELREELGIEVRDARPLIRIRHGYSDRTVILDTWCITRWDGTLHGHDGQAFDWVARADLPRHDLLAADLPIVSALRLPEHYVFSAGAPDAVALARLPPGALLRLRCPELDDRAYEALARTLARRWPRLVLDRAPALSRDLGAGWHATSTVLRSVLARHARNLDLSLASCHDEAEIALARERGFHGVVLGPVLPTASHPGAATLGWERFAALAQSANVPVYGIGGLGPAQLGSAFAAYAQGVAGISAYWG